VLNKIKRISKRKIGRERLLIKSLLNLTIPWIRIIKEIRMKQTKRRFLRMKRSNKTLMIERKPMRTLLRKPRRRSKLNRLHLKHILLVLELRLRRPLMKLTIHLNNKIQSSLKID